MIFISSTVPFDQIPNTHEGIDKTGWFLFSIRIDNKNYEKDWELYKMYSRLHWYPFFYKEKLYNYLMSDNFYFKSNFYKDVMKHCGEFICMSKVKRLEEITDYDKEVIKEKDFIFKEKDIKKMFDSFRENNFKKNHVCEYVLGGMKSRN